jgi:hypothetical protein
MSRETQAERRVWGLLTSNFRLQIPEDYPVKVEGGSSDAARPERLQVFEFAMAGLFARLRPEYTWTVTPDRPDGGIDFVGRHPFLRDQALGIECIITIGGQCKKRTRVDNILNDVSGSLVGMAVNLHPTFFVVAFSAHLDPKRVEEATDALEQTFHRDCHILDRRQIEGLFGDHLTMLGEILRKALPESEVREVLEYIESRSVMVRPHSLTCAVTERVLAGVPFRVTVSVRYAIVSRNDTRLWWRPSSTAEADAHRVTLIGPIGADGPMGAALGTNEVVDDPLYARFPIELLSYSVGTVDLGEILVGAASDLVDDREDMVRLGSVRVVENLQPRFFDRPFRAGLARMSHEYERALAAGVGAVGVVGAGGSGKSRMCEEFALERRRRGSGLVSARQAQTLDDPHKLLAGLLVGLATAESRRVDAAERVIQAVSQYDAALADRAGPAIRSVFGSDDRVSGTVTEESMLSAIILLTLVRGSRAPLIVHLQDLHWCSADVLLMLEQLVWQLGLILSSPEAPPRTPESGVLFIFEGRIRESYGQGADAWTSEPFEAFLQKLGCTKVRCASFEPGDGLEFTRRLFEDQYSGERLVAADLLDLQGRLIRRINRTAGGNPFHTIEQVQLLKELGVLGQNPATGLLYMIRLGPVGALLPDSVFESIRLRWQYLRDRAPGLALLLWATAVLEDRIPTILFRRLWREIAPIVSIADIEATDVLRMGEGEDTEVAFRHENYFQSVRRFEVSAHDRQRVVDVYSAWFAGFLRLGPADRFRWARVLLELPEPDVRQAQTLMRAALRGARSRDDLRLARRIAAASLDLAWSQHARSAVDMAMLLRICDDDIDLARELLSSDRVQATRRLQGLRERIDECLSSGRARSPHMLERLQRRRFSSEVLRSEILFNDGKPALAAELAAAAVRDIRALHPSESSADIEAWKTLEMEALHTEAVALALSGENERAFETSARAVEIARGSSSPQALNIISTYANIGMTRDPVAAESILRQCLADALAAPAHSEATNLTEVHLSMALVLQAHRLASDDADGAEAMLVEAHARLKRVFTGGFGLGRYPDAAAAALMLGLVSVLREDDDEASWFAQAVAAAARGRQMETLWRAHINLATALHYKDAGVTQSTRDHARAALEIMEDTLSPYPEPEWSPRFHLLRAPMAQAVRFLVSAGDEIGLAALERYPALRAGVQDPAASVSLDDRGEPPRYAWWLRTGRGDYEMY